MEARNKASLQVEELTQRVVPVGVRLNRDVLIIRGTPAVEHVMVEIRDFTIRVWDRGNWWSFDSFDINAIQWRGKGEGDTLTVLLPPIVAIAPIVEPLPILFPLF